MFGLRLRAEEWVLLAVLAYFLFRVAFAAGQVVSRWAAAGPPAKSSIRLAILSGMATAAAMWCGITLGLAAAPVALQIALKAASLLVGNIVGFMADLALNSRMTRLSAWLAARRVPQFRQQLASDDEVVRFTAAKRLYELGPYATPAVPELVTAAKDESATVRAHALLALLASLTDDESVIAAARPALADPDVRVRATAAMVLTRTKQAPVEDVLPALAEGVFQPDEPFAELAAGAIGEWGEGAAPAAAALRAAVLDRVPPNSAVVHQLHALGAAGVPVLVEVVRRGTTADKQTAVWALTGMGVKTPDVLVALREASNGPDKAVSMAANLALQKFGANRV